MQGLDDFEDPSLQWFSFQRCCFAKHGDMRDFTGGLVDSHAFVDADVARLGKVEGIEDICEVYPAHTTVLKKRMVDTTPDRSMRISAH